MGESFAELVVTEEAKSGGFGNGDFDPQITSEIVRGREQQLPSLLLPQAQKLFCESLFTKAQTSGFSNIWFNFFSLGRLINPHGLQ